MSVPPTIATNGSLNYVKTSSLQESIKNVRPWLELNAQGGIQAMINRLDKRIQDIRRKKRKKK